jgi:hypothetical protein
MNWVVEECDGAESVSAAREEHFREVEQFASGGRGMTAYSQ